MAKKINSKVQISTQDLTERLSKIIMRMMPFTTALPEIYDLLKDISNQRTDLDTKIVCAHKALQETSALLSELEIGLKERTEKLATIKKDYEQYSKLAAVEEDKAKVLIQQIELTIGKGKTKEWFISLSLNLIAGIVVFLLGIYFGPSITKLMGIVTK